MMTKKINTLFRLIVATSLFVCLLPTSVMAAENANVQVAKDLYAAFTQGDMAKVMSLYAEDAELVFHAPEEIINHGGTFKGREGIQQFFEEINKHFAITAIGQRKFLVDGDVVSVIGWENGVSKATGGQYTSNWVHIMTIKDGVITHFEEMTDSAAIAEAQKPADVERGRAFYTTCLGCHGLEGEGMASMHAPRLTLQGSDYLTRQLRNFRSNVRGGVTDFYGWMMNGRATALGNDRAIRDVVAYIDTLPDTSANDKVDGDVAAGQTIYSASCASCHGEKAMGNDALNSPRLAGLDGWYQVEQLTKFKSGLRGSHKADVIGNQMHASAAVLNNEQAIKDVTAYILSIKN